MDAVGHLLEALFATFFVVVIWGTQDFLCLFISNPCVDPWPPPKKYEGGIMELWTGEKSNCHFYGLCYKDSRPREFQVSCLWLVHCMFVVDTCDISDIYIYINKENTHIYLYINKLSFTKGYPQVAHRVSECLLLHNPEKRMYMMVYPSRSWHSQKAEK